MSPEMDDMLSARDRADIQKEYDAATQAGKAEPIPWRCARGWHPWSKWWQTRHGDVTTDGVTVGHYLEQQRICLGCHKIQMRKERV